MVELERSPARYDVVFTDVVTPGRSGIELAGEIAHRFPELPVGLTSGYSHVLAREGTRGLKLLRKLYSIDELAEVLAQAAKRQ